MAITTRILNEKGSLFSKGPLRLEFDKTRNIKIPGVAKFRTFLYSRIGYS